MSARDGTIDVATRGAECRMNILNEKCFMRPTNFKLLSQVK
jgi:hypothetical protein